MSISLFRCCAFVLVRLRCECLCVFLSVRAALETMEGATQTVPTVVGNNSVGYTKDTDAMKLFVGQIPKTYEESHIREIMETFGPIYEITVIKDRAYGTHKGGGSLYSHARVTRGANFWRPI